MSTPADLTVFIVIAAGVGIAAAIDARTGRVPNALVVAIALAGVLLASLGTSGVSPSQSLIGGLLGLLLLAPGHVLGGTGAGDVKLMAAVGTVLGPAGVIAAFLYTALAGGALALAIAAVRGGAGETLAGVGALMARPAVARRRIAERAGNRFPYAPAIAAGSVIAVVVRGLS